jgi:ferredoxin-NADP reductase
MKIFKATLIERIRRTSSIESFRFLPEEKINFIPGQFTQVLFDTENKNNRDLNKYLSFSSSPAKEYVEVTKRISESTFSKKLINLACKDQISLAQPMGNCIFKDEYTKIGFLVGGIGITPVIAIIEHIIDKKLATDVRLFYSNRTESDIAFKKELDQWALSYKNIRIVYFVTEGCSQNKNYVYGRIDKDSVKNNSDNIKERIFYMIGPPKMVAAMKEICLNIGCSQDKIKTENFVGY